jgi:hypothetical protein
LYDIHAPLRPADWTLGNIDIRLYHLIHFLILKKIQDDQVCRVIKDTQMFDATQKKLPYNYCVPYIGWNSVNDKMSSRTPYEPTMSWQFKTRREYGIPIPRKK